MSQDLPKVLQGLTPDRGTGSPQNTGPENLSDILGRLFTSRGWGKKSARTALENAWAEVAGTQILADARVVVIRRGILEIEVRTAVLLQELSQFHKRRLLEGMRKRLPDMTINDIKFRAGAWQ